MMKRKISQRYEHTNMMTRRRKKRRSKRRPVLVLLVCALLQRLRRRVLEYVTSSISCHQQTKKKTTKTKRGNRKWQKKRKKYAVPLGVRMTCITAYMYVRMDQYTNKQERDKCRDRNTREEHVHKQQQLYNCTCHQQRQAQAAHTVKYTS